MQTTILEEGNSLFDLNPYRNQLPTASPDLEFIITIPAKNEANSIWKTLNSLAQQLMDGAPFPCRLFEVFILCNQCEDNTSKICKNFKHTYPFFPLYTFETFDKEINSVGAARRLVMDLASERLKDNNYIIMTDADTVADPYWLEAYYHLKKDAIDLICGLILPDLTELSNTAKTGLHQYRHYLELVARLKKDFYGNEANFIAEHTYNSGPNMAIKNAEYKNIGGIPPLGCFEDYALYQKVLQRSSKVTHALTPVVTTSCRTSSKVEHGFGSQIRKWETKEPQMVESFLKLKEKFTAFKELRSYYSKPSYELLISTCKRLKCPPDYMIKLIKNHNNSISLSVKIEELLKTHITWNTSYPDIPIQKAITQINSYYSTFCQQSNSYSSAL